jgi:competence protein ComEC
MSPKLLFALAAIPVLVFVVCFRAKRTVLASCLIALFLAACVGWGSNFTDRQLQHRLPHEQYGSDLAVRGCISSEVELQNRSGRTVGRFSLVLEPNSLSPLGLRQIRVSWFDAPAELQAGDCLEAIARLKPPRSYANGLPYDYVASMMFQGVDATGYLRHATVINKAPGHTDWSMQLKQRLKHWLSGALSGEAQRWVAGLVFGDKKAFTNSQWQLVRDTGTLHLLVVSGLHVGIVGVMSLLPGMVMLRIAAVALSLMRRPASVEHLRWFPPLLALIITAVYVWVAGSGISLLRAWVMFAVVLLIWQNPRRIPRTTVLIFAALMVMVINPLSWTQAGFAYSFAAVAALVLYFEGQRNSKLTAIFLPQFVVLICLLPIMTYWGQSSSAGHLVANLVAIPLVTLVILPLALTCLTPLATLTGPWMTSAGEWFWSWLDIVDGLGLPSIYVPTGTSLLIFAVSLGLWLLGARLLSLLVSVLLMWTAIFTANVFELSGAASQKAGLWLVDSGQGQALLVSDGAHHVLIDTGPAFGEQFSVASSALVPLMRREGIHHLDALVISHGDNDHAGGVDDILRAVNVDRLFVGENLSLGIKKVSQKRAKDGVAEGLVEEAEQGEETVQQQTDCHQLAKKTDTQIHVLSDAFQLTFLPVPKAARTNANNHSCVVVIEWMTSRILVPGDIDMDVERSLIAAHGGNLKVDVLVAAHHGSRSSTSNMWLNTVRPNVVLFSAGYRNSFGHPHPDVVKRLGDGVVHANTATAGMITLSSEGRFSLERAKWLPHWHAPADDERDFSLHGHVLE